MGHGGVLLLGCVLVVCMGSGLSEQSSYDELVEFMFEQHDTKYQQERLQFIRKNLNPYTGNNLLEVLSDWKTLLSTAVRKIAETQNAESALVKAPNPPGIVVDGFNISKVCYDHTMMIVIALGTGNLWATRSMQSCCNI